MQHYLDDPEVEALAFDYLHFYGDTQHLHMASQAYRKATRIMRNSIRSIAPDGLYWAVIKEKNLARRAQQAPHTLSARRCAEYADLSLWQCAPRTLRAGQSSCRQPVLDGKTGLQLQLCQHRSAANRAVCGLASGGDEALVVEHANTGFAPDPAHVLTRRERKHRRLARLEQRFGWDLSKRHFKLIRSFDA